VSTLRIRVSPERHWLMAAHLVPEAEKHPAQYNQCKKYPQDYPGTQRQLTLALQVVFVFVYRSGHRGKLNQKVQTGNY
jgi:hypothetical protein